MITDIQWRLRTFYEMSMQKWRINKRRIYRIEHFNTKDTIASYYSLVSPRPLQTYALVQSISQSLYTAHNCGSHIRSCLNYKPNNCPLLFICRPCSSRQRPKDPRHPPGHLILGRVVIRDRCVGQSGSRNPSMSNLASLLEYAHKLLCSPCGRP